jgi:hypothetical protein
MTRLFAACTSIVALALVAASGSWLAAADIPPPPPAPAGERVHFAGCVEAGVETSCLIVKSEGKTYNVSSAKGLKVGDFAAGTGVPGGVSFCQQGIVLSEIVLDNPQPSHGSCAK